MVFRKASFRATGGTKPVSATDVPNMVSEQNYFTRMLLIGKLRRVTNAARSANFAIE